MRYAQNIQQPPAEENYSIQQRGDGLWYCNGVPLLPYTLTIPKNPRFSIAFMPSAVPEVQLPMFIIVWSSDDKQEHQIVRRCSVYKDFIELVGRLNNGAELTAIEPSPFNIGPIVPAENNLTQQEKRLRRRHRRRYIDPQTREAIKLRGDRDALRATQRLL